jgi:hypothetical protein
MREKFKMAHYYAPPRWILQSRAHILMQCDKTRRLFDSFIFSLCILTSKYLYLGLMHDEGQLPYNEAPKPVFDCRLRFSLPYYRIKCQKDL